MTKRLCGVYCIENLTNGKKYIGYSSRIVKGLEDKNGSC